MAKEHAVELELPPQPLAEIPRREPVGFEPLILDPATKLQIGLLALIHGSQRELDLESGQLVEDAGGSLEDIGLAALGIDLEQRFLARANELPEDGIQA